ncbi:MAG TPA: DUF6624 domain-containing protein [Ktedonobacteraceae bacterium]|nr:DUF6624 domain-containing protein [Ktedonobacteraceae bacterium]
MIQDIIANFFTFSDFNGTLQITYYPQARLDYQGPEGRFIYPGASPDRDMTIQEQSFLGQQITIVLTPAADGPSVTLTLLLPPMNMAGQHEQDFDTLAIKTTSSGLLSPRGALLTYEVISLQGIAQHLLHPLYSWQGPLSDEPQEAFKAIANEIMKMSEVDQQMRKRGQWDASIDVANTQRMKEIVEHMGWPTRSKVGSPASKMAWQLVQHADHDRAFQQACLDLMKAQAPGEVSPVNIAYLEDRVRVAEGRPQVYGTQFYSDEAGKVGPRPIEDPDHVDERRQAVGLQPLSDYAREVEQSYQECHPS